MSGVSFSTTTSRTISKPDDNILPITGVMPYTPTSIQIGLSNYMTKEDTPSLQVLGLLADPNIDPEEKKERLLNEFYVDIDRDMTEDYEYLDQLEES